MPAFKGNKNLLLPQRPVVISKLYPDQLQRVSSASAEEFFDLFKGLDYGKAMQSETFPRIGTSRS
jgi:hypothetical protein